MRHPFSPFTGRGGTAGRLPAEGEEKGPGSSGRRGLLLIPILLSTAVRGAERQSSRGLPF